jgi:hypothetical protein
MGVRLAAADGRMVRELVVGSWRSVAPRKLVAAYDA